jgi:hypothetical protein
MTTESVEERKRHYSRELAAHTLRQWNVARGVSESDAHQGEQSSSRNGGAVVRNAVADSDRTSRHDKSQNHGQTFTGTCHSPLHLNNINCPNVPKIRPRSMFPIFQRLQAKVLTTVPRPAERGSPLCCAYLPHLHPPFGVHPDHILDGFVVYL